jgi:hypothetical protein
MDESDDIDVYKVLSQQNTSFYSELPKAYFPSPDASEYSAGYIRRFFSRKANDKNAPIIEISEHTASLFVNNPFHTIVSVAWKISGQLNTITRAGVEYEEGVSEHNYRTSAVANGKMPGLLGKLSNTFQFYKK